MKKRALYQISPQVKMVMALIFCGLMILETKNVTDLT